VAEAVLGRHTRRVFDVLMRRGAPPEDVAARIAAEGLDMNPFRRIGELEPFGEAFLTPEELDVYVESFERTGFAGGVSWYRNLDRNWETAPAVGSAKIEVPSLMVTAEWDQALRPEMAAGMPALVSDLETILIEKCGHWTQQEKPAELNRILVDWLSRRMA
jgi:pimeloyl-ACP methyl ester carboxylesterase